MTEKFSFKNEQGEELSGRLESPDSQAPKAYALFAHCFTCSKDVLAATKISKALTDYGIAVLRFDFTGLGNSQGDFSNTNFSSNVSDLVAASKALKESKGEVKLLIGHSLGGAAVLYAASQIESCEAVVTIGAPSDVEHIQHLFGDQLSEMQNTGFAEVTIAGRTFKVKRQFVEDLKNNNLLEQVSELRKPLLIFHSPQDQIVGVEHAKNIYQAAYHSKSFISLDKADHLLSNKQDSQYVASVIASWAQRYLSFLASDFEVSSLNSKISRSDSKASSVSQTSLGNGQVLVESRGPKWTQDISTSEHKLVADEPEKVQGQNLGPNPYELLLSSLGACTSMTIQMYAQRKEWPVKKVRVWLSHEKKYVEDCQGCEDKKSKVDFIKRKIQLQGDLSEEQRQRLLEIADKCPVHRTLSSEIRITTEELGS